MHKICIYIHLRTTINIDDDLLERASNRTGNKEKTALVKRGLEALIALESAKRKVYSYLRESTGFEEEAL
jgi:Arc/MetJ family transcription regulator